LNVVFLFDIAFVENDYTKVFKTTCGSLNIHGVANTAWTFTAVNCFVHDLAKASESKAVTTYSCMPGVVPRNYVAHA